MAKRPKGMSSREMAASKAGGTLNYKTGKITVAPKLVAKPSGINSSGGSNGFIGPVMPATMYGPTAPGSTVQPGYYNPVTKGATPITQREQASKAQSNKGNGGSSNGPSILSGLNNIKSGSTSQGLNIGNGMDTSSMSSLLSKPGPTDTLRGGGGGIFDAILRKGSGLANEYLGSVTKATADRGTGMPSNILGANTAEASGQLPGESFSDFLNRINNPSSDGTGGLGRALQQSSVADIPTGAGDNGTIFYNNNDKQNTFTSDFATPGTNFSRPGSELAYNQGQGQSPVDYGKIARDTLGIQSANASSGDTTNNGGNNNGDNNNNNTNPWGDNSPMGNGEGDANLPQYQNPNNLADYNTPVYDNNNPSQTSGNISTKRNNPIMSGYAGNGALVTNKANEDPYIKELRKAYASNGGEKWLRQQFDELIKSLDPTYAQMQTEGTNALNANLQNNSNQLASVMNAGNVGDSEQRTQQLAGLQNGNQTALGQLLAKLSTAKAGDVSQYKSQMAGKLGEYQQTNQTNQQKLMEAIRNHKNDLYDQQYKNASLNAKSGNDKIPGVNTAWAPYQVQNFTNQMAGKGYNWQDIADTANANGIDTTSGSYFDNLMRNKNGLNRINNYGYNPNDPFGTGSNG